MTGLLWLLDAPVDDSSDWPVLLLSTCLSALNLHRTGILLNRRAGTDWLLSNQQYIRFLFWPIPEVHTACSAQAVSPGSV